MVVQPCNHSILQLEAGGFNSMPFLLHSQTLLEGRREGKRQERVGRKGERKGGWERGGRRDGRGKLRERREKRELREMGREPEKYFSHMQTWVITLLPAQGEPLTGLQHPVANSLPSSIYLANSSSQALPDSQFHLVKITTRLSGTPSAF
jgi:hypothetical protein